MKKCTKCKKIKKLFEFNKDKTHKDGLRTVCKLCDKKWRKLNREKLKKQKKKYYEDNKEKILSSLRKYYEDNRKNIIKNIKSYQQKYPWKVVLRNIKQRCNNPNNNYYYCYGGRGIKCLIVEEEIKKLWFRDKACNLDQPSIDRKDNDGHYTFDNCQFIEMREMLPKI